MTVCCPNCHEEFNVRPPSSGGERPIAEVLNATLGQLGAPVPKRDETPAALRRMRVLLAMAKLRPSGEAFEHAAELDAYCAGAGADAAVVEGWRAVRAGWCGQ